MKSVCNAFFGFFKNFEKIYKEMKYVCNALFCDFEKF